jgi:hypothetical protein
MEKNISDELEEVIRTKSPNNPQINGYIKAEKEYERLVKDGLATKRGYNLLTTEEIYLPVSSCTFSQSFQKPH